MAKDDRTDIGGQHEAFRTTSWTRILQARSVTPGRRQDAVCRIAEQYWKPVYAYLRRKGKGNDDAKDLTQGFFQEVVLGRSLIQRADPGKGRFRTFLLTALDRYVASRCRAEMARKRLPAGRMVRLDGADAPGSMLRDGAQTPEEAFAYAWACQLLADVIRTVADGCLRAGQQTHWEVFRRRVVEPILHGTQAPPLEQLCQELHIAGQNRASNMMVTVKRRFQETLRRSVRRLVESDQDVEEEIQELMQILRGSRAG